MPGKGSSQYTDALPAAKNRGWKGILFNICFLLYYYFTWQWIMDESRTVNSYGLGSPILFSKTLAWVILVSLIAEPFAVFYKLSYEHYRVKGTALPLPRFFIVIMFISRFFVRIVFFIAALESAGIEVENGGTGAAITGTFVFVSELVFAFAITDKEFTGRVRPSLYRELFTRFILLNMLALFSFLFGLIFVPLLTLNGHHFIQDLLTGILLLAGIYLPNTMLQFYSDWRACSTLFQKSLYVFSFLAGFLAIILFSRA